MDNKKCLIFIFGFDSILDDKYTPFSHPMFSQTADGDGVPYEHKPAKDGESAEPGFTILNKKSLEYYEGLKQKGELKRAMDTRVPKEVILSYFYPETSVVKMMEIRRQYE